MPEHFRPCQSVLRDVVARTASNEIKHEVDVALSRSRRLALRLAGSDDATYDNASSFLDGLKLPCDAPKASSSLLRLTNSIKESVFKLMMWAADLYTIQSYRRYLAFSILVHWTEDGLDITECILDLLPRLDKCAHINCRVISSIVAELTRAGHFNAAGALRSFIVNGTISGVAEDQKV